MAITVKIAGVDRNSKIVPGTLSVQKTYGDPWTCDFETVSQGLDGWYYPNVGESVLVEVNGAPYWGGTIRRVERHKTNALTDVLKTTVNCTDYNQITERRLAGEYEWIGQTAQTIITDIVTNSLSDEGIDTSLVETGPVVDNFRVSYSTVAAAFAALLEVCQGYRLYIDAEKKLRFFNGTTSPTTTPAAFDIPEAANNIHTLRVAETDEDYCNFVIGRVGQSLRDPQTETFTGSSPQTVFETAFPLAQAPTITLDGVTPQTVGIASVDTGRDWYWSQGSTEIRQDSVGAPITGTLEVNYVGIESIYVLAKDDGEIAARAAIEGGSGRYEKLIEIDQMVTRADAQAIVDGYLYDHINIPLVATYTTSDLIEPDAKNLEPGTTQSIMLDGWGAQQYTYLVRSIRATQERMNDQATLQFRYEVEAIFGSLTKTVFQWFKDLGSGSAPAGSRVDGDIEYFYWFLGGCEAVTAGTDVAAHWPTVHKPGRIGVVSLHCKTSPTSDLILDIKVTADGVTWDSIFESGSVTYPAGRTTPLFISNISAEGSAIYTGQWLRVDVTQGGGAEGLSIKAAARPGVGRVGSTLFDNSQASGVTGTDETTEGLLVLL